VPTQTQPINLQLVVLMVLSGYAATSYTDVMFQSPILFGTFLILKLDGLFTKALSG